MAVQYVCQVCCVQACKKKQAELSMAVESSVPGDGAAGGSAAVTQGAPHVGGYVNNLITNIAVVLALACFAFIVKNVLSGITD